MAGTAWQYPGAQVVRWSTPEQLPLGLGNTVESSYVVAATCKYPGLGLSTEIPVLFQWSWARRAQGALAQRID